MDPSRQEEEFEGSETRSSGREGGHLTIGMMPNYANGQIALTLQEGQMAVDNICEGLEIAVDTCQRIYTLSRKVTFSKYRYIYLLIGIHPTLGVPESSVTLIPVTTCNCLA